jgi:hypothetical protein
VKAVRPAIAIAIPTSNERRAGNEHGCLLIVDVVFIFDSDRNLDQFRVRDAGLCCAMSDRSFGRDTAYRPVVHAPGISALSQQLCQARRIVVFAPRRAPDA